jgi:hypothetical protein
MIMVRVRRRRITLMPFLSLIRRYLPNIFIGAIGFACRHNFAYFCLTKLMLMELFTKRFLVSCQVLTCIGRRLHTKTTTQERKFECRIILDYWDEEFLSKKDYTDRLHTGMQEVYKVPEEHNAFFLSTFLRYENQIGTVPVCLSSLRPSMLSELSVPALFCDSVSSAIKVSLRAALKVFK